MPADRTDYVIDDSQVPFGFAAFDNAQVRHAVHFDAKYLAFAK